MYGETFKLPQPVFAKTGVCIMVLDDPTKKISKSDTSETHSSSLLDSPDDIRLKIIRTNTVSLHKIRFDKNRPGIHKPLIIYRLLSGLGQAEIKARSEGKGYAHFKRELAEVIVENLKSMQSHYRELAADPGYMDHLLEQGDSKMRHVTGKTMSIVKGKIGLG